MMSVMIFAQLALITVVLINAFEFTELLWQKRRKRHFSSISEKKQHYPKISIHLACYNEPFELMQATLTRLSELNYPNFEVLVLDNNTQDPETWRPLQQFCQTLGARFRFFHLEPWSGYKAGALNFGLAQTAKDAAFIAVIDADYLVDRDWLKHVVTHFDDPQVGFVQAPQDHREWEGDLFKTMINWEYAGFFNIGMVHRNERNAIIQHGTMTLIRKQAIFDAGAWSEWCICEDTELGLRMMQAGYTSVYINHSFGHGVVPDTFTAYKVQRFRWAYGAVQILKKYWRSMLPFSKSQLSTAQKFHFITGWLPWFADALHLVFSLSTIVWSIGLLFLPEYFEFPMPLFLFSVLVLFTLKIVHGFVLYQTHVRCNFMQRLGAMLAGLSLTHVVGRAILAGLFQPGKPFLRTPKNENKPALTRGLLMAYEESILWIIMWFLAALIIHQYHFGYIHKIILDSEGNPLPYTPDSIDAVYWAILLVIQSLPYFMALLVSLINVWPNSKKSA